MLMIILSHNINNNNNKPHHHHNLFACVGPRRARCRCGPFESKVVYVSLDLCASSLRGGRAKLLCIVNLYRTILSTCLMLVVMFPLHINQTLGIDI